MGKRIDRQRDRLLSEAVAGSGLLHRRTLLRGGIVLAGASVAVGPNSAGAEPARRRPLEPGARYGHPTIRATSGF